MQAPRTLNARLARLARAAYGAVAALAAMALLGWLMDVAPLRDLGANLSPMSPAAALGLGLAAASFFAAEAGRAGSARTAAALAALIALLSLAESLTGTPLGMRFAFVAAGGEAPAAMAPAASLALLVLALATPLHREARVLGVSAAGLAASVLAALSLFALLGMSLRLLRFEVAAPLLGISAPQAIATLLAAAALALSRPTAWLLDALVSRRPGAVIARWLLPAAFFLPVVVGWTRLAAEREGIFGEAFGMALFTAMMIASFGALVLWVARTIDRMAAERAQAEEQAGESREWLQVTLAAIGDGVIATDGAGRVRFLNAAAQRLTGWRASEAAGRPIDELMQLVDERDGAILECPLHEALRARDAVAAEGEPALRSRDGAVHPVTINAAPIADAGAGLAGAVLVLREAAAQRRAERAMREAYTELDQRVIRRTAALERASAALRERNALLNAITASTPDLIFAKDRQGRTLMANPAWARAVAQLEHVGTELDRNERLVLETGEAMILEETIAERTYLTTKAPLRDEQARIIGLIGVATDITERKQAQRELEKLVLAEQRLRAEAERANRAKDEFLAIVSHELRSPLNALRGWSHLLATTRPLDPQLVERASKAIKRNVDQQTRLIDDLLDTSRIVSGKLTIERRVVNVAEVALAAIDAARPGAAAKSIDLRFRSDAPAIMVVGDPGRLQQLFSNLLSNALKFTAERGEVTVVLLRNADRVQLQVKDTGAGIPPEFLPHVFDRFTQADTSAARRAGGLGIGLALVRHIALLHGGQVRADSAGAGRGATFTVELPAAPADAQPAMPGPGERRRAGAGTLAGTRVWVADDDAEAHEIVELTLRQTGAEVQGFGSGGELIEGLERELPERGPDVMLIDLAMPGEDGFEALRRVRSLEKARKVDRATPALALTAFTQIERERLKAAGFADRVDKPVDAEKLIAAIRAVVPDRRHVSA